jgi:uncharacterized membrane protein YeaQ/YmgE (transglycosylase-associated protein family)
MWDLIVAILAGAFIGWIASMIMKTNASMGAIANILAGIAGAFVGNILAGLIGIETDALGFSIIELIFGIIGACIVIGIVKMLTGKRSTAV